MTLPKIYSPEIITFIIVKALLSSKRAIIAPRGEKMKYLYSLRNPAGILISKTEWPSGFLRLT